MLQKWLKAITAPVLYNQTIPNNRYAFNTMNKIWYDITDDADDNILSGYSLNEAIEKNGPASTAGTNYLIHYL